MDILVQILVNLLSDIIVVILTFFFTKNWVVRTYLKKEFRFMNNLKRDIYYFESNSKWGGYETLEHADILGNLKKKSYALSALEHKNSNLGIIIIEYSKKDEGTFDKIFEAAKAQNLPILIFTMEDITDKNKYLSYTNADLVNSPMRLLSMVFTILATYRNT